MTPNRTPAAIIVATLLICITATIITGTLTFPTTVFLTLVAFLGFATCLSNPTTTPKK